MGDIRNALSMRAIDNYFFIGHSYYLMPSLVQKLFSPFFGILTKKEQRQVVFDSSLRALERIVPL